MTKSGLRETPELPLGQAKRLCANCENHEVYMEIKTMDWCEACIAKFVAL